MPRSALQWSIDAWGSLVTSHHHGSRVDKPYFSVEEKVFCVVNFSVNLFLLSPKLQQITDEAILQPPLVAFYWCRGEIKHSTIRTVYAYIKALQMATAMHHVKTGVNGHKMTDQ